MGAAVLAQAVYGKAASDLTTEEKANLLASAKLLAGIASGAVSTGNGAETLANASVGMTVAENAVENNAFLDSQVSDLFKDLEKAEKEGSSLEEVFRKYKELSDKQLQDIQENCQSAWCRYGVEKNDEEANQRALELVGFFNSQLSTLSNATQERFIEFVISENAKEIDFINGARTPLEKAIVFLVNNFVEDRENKGIKISPQIASFAKKTTLAKPIEYLSKPKQKVNSSSIGDIVRTPTTHAEDFERKRDSKGNAVYVNKHTGEIWSKSNTRHSDKAGEWKVGLNGKEPTASKKITIGDSDGKIIKKDDK
ncbi:VENN motif pre-toxin domain-containing protein [Mannheimia pernigra]|uniref:VENN motif pre-toxin domain-containing protein n=1 Tax=Mannheimia pernigra TaxID=111844 RepID=UPI0023540417|nr:VENN motif pre-toxin domain-containing protein [Mannheimia pernigra]